MQFIMHVSGNIGWQCWVSKTMYGLPMLELNLWLARPCMVNKTIYG